MIKLAIDLGSSMTKIYRADTNSGVVLAEPSCVAVVGDEEIKAIGKVVVDYKNKNGENSIYAYVFDYASPNVYEIKDNYFFKNLQWTEAEIKSILDLYFIPNIRDIAYVPFELDMIGLLYLEAGDYVNILTKDGGINSFILNRSISGIHSMKDFISAKGKELNVDISDKSIVTEGE